MLAAHFGASDERDYYLLNLTPGATLRPGYDAPLAQIPLALRARLSVFLARFTCRSVLDGPTVVKEIHLVPPPDPLRRQFQPPVPA